jgi:hypothetical protein
MVKSQENNHSNLYRAINHIYKTEGSRSYKKLSKIKALIRCWLKFISKTWKTRKCIGFNLRKSSSMAKYSDRRKLGFLNTLTWVPMAKTLAKREKWITSTSLWNRSKSEKSELLLRVWLLKIRSWESKSIFKGSTVLTTFQLNWVE